jgi:UDP-N-acetylmuramate dehydrogenase
MIERTNEPMIPHTLMRCGGTCERILIPESEDELLECCTNYAQARILGAGSNILPADGTLKGTVIKNTRACLRMELDGHTASVGSSVRLGAFVRFLVSRSLVGYEYLASVPGSLGGALYMNAGRGRRTGTSISDYLKRVKIWNGSEVEWLEKDTCKFGYRQSVFQQRKYWVILGAEFELPEQPTEIGLTKIRDRLAETREWQDLRYPSLGSAFSRVSPLAARQMLGVRRGDAAFSEKTPNWLVNLGNAKTKDFLWLIRLMRLRSLVFGVIAHLEITIWK